MTESSRRLDVLFLLFELIGGVCVCVCVCVIVCVCLFVCVVQRDSEWKIGVKYKDFIWQR